MNIISSSTESSAPDNSGFLNIAGEEVSNQAEIPRFPTARKRAASDVQPKEIQSASYPGGVPEWRRTAAPLITIPIAASTARTGPVSRSSPGINNNQHWQNLSTLFYNTSDFQEDRGYVRWGKEKLHIGSIIRAPVHEQNLNFTGTPLGTSRNSPSLDPSAANPVYTKVRKLIVIAVHPDHYIALPCFTFSGRGLAHRLSTKAFISIRDHRSEGSFEALSCHEPVMTENLEPGIEPFDPKTCVWVTYPVSRRYGVPCAYEGNIDGASIDRVLREYRNQGPGAPSMRFGKK